MKAHFVGHLDTRQIDNDRAQLLHPLMFYSEKYRGLFVVPRGFVTDFNSIPRLFGHMLPKRGKHDPAGVLHDAAYQGQCRTEGGVRQRLVKSVADAVFDEALEASGVSRFVRWAMVRAVKARGGGAYRDHPPVESTHA